jgi:hypothetical protein
MRKLWVCVALEKPATTCGARVRGVASCGWPCSGRISSQHVRSAYQPPPSSIFLSEKTSQQQSVSSTFLSEQISTAISHQPNEQAVKGVLLR